MSSDVKWEDYFYYDESSPSCLRWKVDVSAGVQYQVQLVAAGDVSGSLSKRDGYWRVFLNRKSYLVHRIIMAMHSGECEAPVDHVNGNRHDNRLCNLRYVSAAENARNAKRQENNTSGKTGVKLTQTHKGRYWNWMATAETEKGRATKAFSVNKYGNDEAFRLACEWRDRMIEELNNQGAGYSERHGT